MRAGISGDFLSTAIKIWCTLNVGESYVKFHSTKFVNLVYLTTPFIVISLGFEGSKVSKLNSSE